MTNPAYTACEAAATPVVPLPIVGTTSPLAGLSTAKHGFYQLTLNTDNGLGGAASPVTIFESKYP